MCATPSVPPFLDPAHGRLGFQHERRRALNRPPRVLIVDADRNTRDFLALGFAACGFEVLTAGDGHHAIHFCRTGPAIAAVLLEQLLPDLSGLETLAVIRRVAPWTRGCLMAGAATRLTAAQLMGVAFVAKPLQLEHTIRTVWHLAQKPLASVG
jgi:DNA-binding NtrC family response regulator